MLAYEEVINFIAAGLTPDQLIAFRPSTVVSARVEDLLFREKETSISDEEKVELGHYLELEHLIRMAKARARHYIHEPAHN